MKTIFRFSDVKISLYLFLSQTMMFDVLLTFIILQVFLPQYYSRKRLYQDNALVITSIVERDSNEV